MADYRDWCNTCGNEINFGRHAPWCGKMTQEEWFNKILDEHFTQVEFNLFTHDPLYTCKKCFALVQERLGHFKFHNPRGL